MYSWMKDDKAISTAGYTVEEPRNTIERNHFIMEYLLAREKSHVLLRECW